MPRTWKDCAKAEEYIGLAFYAYGRKSPLPTGWQPAQEIMAALNARVAKAAPENLRTDCRFVLDKAAGENVLYDQETGVVAVVVEHPVKKKIVLVFGGTHSGPRHGEGASPEANASYRAVCHHQYVADIQAALGLGTPAAYRVAHLWAQQLDQLLAEDTRQYGAHQGYALETSGHSLGGGLAEYAAMADKEGDLPATVFAPAQLNNRLLQDLPPDHLSRSARIVSFSERRDLVPEVGKFIPGRDGVGTAYAFDGIEGKSWVHAHSFEYEHLAEFLKRTLRMSDAMVAVTNLMMAPVIDTAARVLLAEQHQMEHMDQAGQVEEQAGKLALLTMRA